MKDTLNIISDTPLFGGLPEDQLQAVKKIIVNKYFEKGEIIFTEGDEGNGFFIVAAGKVKIFKLSSEGKEQTLHIFGPGEPFGEVPVFSGESFPANAQSIAKSHLLFFPRTAFVDLISANSSLSLNMLAVLAMRLRQFTVQIEHLSLKEIPARLAAYLIFLSDKQKNPELVTLKISKGQLASLLGTIPETLSRIFGKMTALNLIEVNGRHIRLLNRERLEELVEEGK